jgi:hypothetical protein
MRGLLLLIVGVVLVRPVLGQKLEFDVASVRANKTGFGEGRDPQRVNVPVGPEETWRDSGGVFSAQNVPLVQMISFAYKVTTGQRAVFRASLPEWTQTEGFNIEARTDNHAVTKDQMREMMRNLLAELRGVYPSGCSSRWSARSPRPHGVAPVRRKISVRVGGRWVVGPSWFGGGGGWVCGGVWDGMVGWAGSGRGGRG